MTDPGRLPGMASDLLTWMLRPAAGGIYTMSTGVEEQRAIQRRIYGLSDAADEGEATELWRAALENLADASLVILGVPSDTGAGYRRGANFGPQALRSALLDAQSWIYRDRRVVDAGDVFVVPHLLHEEMLSESQIAACRPAVYGAHADEARALGLPVAPLSIAERALALVREINPRAAMLVLGGDHSIGWPALAATAAGRQREIGILHFDAHTDLHETRLGVRYCFGTWAYHANEFIGRGGRLQQVGLRASSRSREHWEASRRVRQYWMSELRTRGVAEVADEITSNLREAGVRGLYISNDIDGTDPSFAAATGTPEPGGLVPDEVIALIERVGTEFAVWGSDLVEVAPTLALDRPGEPHTTLTTAVRYIEAQARVSLATANPSG